MSMERGLACLQAGDPDGAVRELELALEKDPQDVAALGHLGVAWAQKGEHEKALGCMRRAVEAQPGDAGLRFNLAREYQQAGQTQLAQLEVSRLLEEHPEHAGARQLLEHLSHTDLPAEGGLVYQEDVPAAAGSSVRPGLFRRLVRGASWGVLFGQWWTLWTAFSIFLWGGAEGMTPPMMLFVAVFLMVIYGLAGGLIGLVIGAANSDESRGTSIGVVGGLIMCGLEWVYLGGNPLNILFYFVTGRYIGRGIALRVQLPLKS